MSINRINNNIASQAINNLNNLIAPQIQQNLERLSSGLRINRAGDDAAGLSIANRLQSQLRGLNEAFDAAQSGINLINTGDQAIGTVEERLQRIRELTVQAGNTGIFDRDAIQAIQSEINQNIDEINRIANTTQFGSNVLFDGSFAPQAGVVRGTPDFGVSIDQSNLSTESNFLSIEQTQAGSTEIVAGDDPGQPQVLNSGISNQQDVAVTTGTLFNSTGGVAAANGDALTDLTFNGVTLQNGGTIAFQGVLADGVTEFNGSIQISALTDLAGGGGASTSLTDAIQTTIDAVEQEQGVNTVGGTSAAETNVSFNAATGRIEFSNGAEEGTSAFTLNFTVVDAGGDLQNTSGITRQSEISGVATGAQTGNSVTSFTGSTLDTGTFDIEISDVVQAQQRIFETTSGFEQGAGGALTATDSLIGSVFNGATLAQGDTIDIQGTNADGTTFTSQITVSNVNAGAGDGAASTFQDLIDELNVRDRTLAAGGSGNQSGFEDATAAISSDGRIRLTDDLAGESQSSFTLTVNDQSAGGGTFSTIVDGGQLVQEGLNESATVRLNGGEGQRVNAGETTTIRNSSGDSSEEITFTLGTNLTEGTDSIRNIEDEFVGQLNNGTSVTFGAGDQNVRFSSGTNPGESLIVDFDNFIDVPGTGAANQRTVLISATSNQVNFQIGANANQQVAVGFGDLRAQSLGLGNGASVADIDVTEEGGVDQALQILDTASEQLGSLRSELGAVSNRLSSTTESLAVTAENVLAAQSRIEDTDFAREATQTAINELLLRSNLAVQAQTNNLQSILFTDLLR